MMINFVSQVINCILKLLKYLLLLITYEIKLNIFQLYFWGGHWQTKWGYMMFFILLFSF